MCKFLVYTLGFAIVVISNSYAQVYMTLPKGVRLLGYRNVNTSKINSTYNQSQAETPLSYGFSANAGNLSGAGDAVKFYFEQLKAINPKAYSDFSYGDYKISGEAQINVQGFGLGYGITDRLSVYGILPYYTAHVKLKYKQTRAANTAEIADRLQRSGQNDSSSAIANITKALPPASGNLLQSVVVNSYGYKPIGDWYGTGYGDMEVGAMYRLVDTGYWGASITGGVVAPTGRVDDPDLLQDIAFGDGQWDAFSEGAAGFSVSDHLRFGLVARYTYQAPAHKTMRIPTNRNFTLGDQKGNFNVKYGDRVDTSLQATVLLNDWFSLTPAYEMFVQQSATYDSPYGKANDYLAYNSNRIGHVGRITGTISSLQPFLKKQFMLPAQINVNYQQTLSGENVPKMSRFEVELRLLF